LPRFLDDAEAAKLMRTSRADPDPLSRLIVELLARTGIRKGELLALNVDAVVQIGSALWLRIPVGNDRFIPLHLQLKEMLDDWITHHRPTGLRSQRLLLEDNRPVSTLRVSIALSRLAHARHRPRHRPPTPAHPGHPGDQPWHEHRCDRRSARAPRPRARSPDRRSSTASSERLDHDAS
jgi:integrase